MKQNDGIAYEKPELLKYSIYGVVTGNDQGTSFPGDSGDSELDPCDDFIDNV